MADFGTFPVRQIPVALQRAAHSDITHQDSSFNIGTFPVRMVGGGGEATIIEVEVIVPAPPSTNGVGDWPMRFAAEESLLSSTADNTLYMCPDVSVLYIRYWQLVNTSASARDVELWMAGFPVLRQTLDPGEEARSPDPFNFVMGDGEIIEAWANGAGVSCLVTGVESVLE